MKHARIWLGIFIAAVLTLISCGGGGGGDSSTNNNSGSIQISTPESTTVDPLARLAISGTGFDPSADLTVSFIEDENFSIDVPVLEATTSSIVVAVPPYVDRSTGKFGSGTVSIRVSQTSAGRSVTSNTISGFQVNSLPDLTLNPGEVTANIAAFLELSLTDTIDRLAQFDAFSGSQIDTAELRTRLEAQRQLYGQLKTDVRNAMADPASAGTVGTINGVAVTLDEENLRAADQLMVAMIDAILAQLQAAAPASLQGAALSGRSSGPALGRASLSATCADYPELCTASGEPLITVKNYATGEETAVTQYEYAIALPGASKMLGNFMDWFAATTATLGALAVTAEVSVPVVAVAAVTEVNVNCMAAKFGMDASRLSANSTDKQAAEDLLDDFNGTLAYLRDSVVSPAIAAISEKAGVAYDLFTGWAPIVADQAPAFLSQFESFIDTAPTVAGSWSGTINNPYLSYDCSGGTAGISFTLTENMDLSISGSMGSVTLSGSRSGSTLSMSESTRWGNRGPFTWAWDGGNTITGQLEYFCWSLDTGGLISQGAGSFSVTRN